MSDTLTIDARTAVENFLFAEAAALDERRFKDWLEMYDPKCEYWVPAWKSEDEPTSDPHTELSLIYYSDRTGLEDRVWRVTAGHSVASFVLPRTHRSITNLTVTPNGALWDARCNWTLHQYLPKERVVQVLFGRAEYTIELSDPPRIHRRKLIVLNDLLPSRLDFYSL